MKTLLETTDPKYLRRMAKAINAQRYGQPMYVTLACGERQRVRAAKYSGRNTTDLLCVRIIGSDMWYPVYDVTTIEGVSASRVAR